MSSKFRFGSRPQQSDAVCAINTPIPDFGGDYFGDTTLHPTAGGEPSPHSGWCAIYVLTTAVLNAATKSNINNINTVSLPAGTWVYGIFSQIQLTSGSIIAYNTTD